MKHSTKQHRKPCNCRSVSECDCNTLAWKKALDACVDDFAEQMKRKLQKKYLEGKTGWDDPNWDVKDALSQLRTHVNKGDMVDVANFAMFIWNKSQ